MKKSMRFFVRIAQFSWILWSARILAFGAFVATSAMAENLLGISAYTLAKQGRWEVESMKMGEHEITIPYDMENAYLTFSGGRINGIVGCNNFFASYEIMGGGKMIAVGQGGMTRKMCASSAESQIEAIFGKHFAGNFIVRGYDDTIELVGSEGFVLRLFPSMALEPF